MYAVILPPLHDPRDGLRRVAGRPILLRQLAWLRSLGVDRVAVAFTGPIPPAVLATLESDPLGLDAIPVGHTAPEPREVVLRAGLRATSARLVIGATTIGDADLMALFRVETELSLMAPLSPPSALEECTPRPFAILDRSRRLQVVGPAEVPGWAATVPDDARARRLGALVLDGTLPLEVHASEIEPGIWISRGARVHRSAELIAPTLVGPDAVIEAKARVGPGSDIGARSVVARGSVLAECMLDDDTVVGEGVLLHRVHGSPGLAVGLDDGQRIAVESAVLGRRSRPRFRTAAVLAMTAVATLALLLS